MGEYYDRQGEPITMDDWVRLFTADNQQVRQSTIGRTHVSTVWLGLNHRFGHEGPPLIFETMVFGLDGDDPQWRYSDETSAVLHHERLVAALKAGEDLPDA